jgi:hypothetical protein
MHINFNLVRIRYKYEDNRGFPSGVVLYNKFWADVSAAKNSSKIHKVREFIGCRNDVFPESSRDVYLLPSVHTGSVPQPASHSMRAGDFPLCKSTWANS